MPEPPFLNAVYEYGQDTTASRKERLLWVDTASAFAVLIEIHGRKSQQHIVPYEYLKRDLLNQSAVRVDDPYECLKSPASSFSRSQIIERDERVAAIQAFLRSPAETQFNPVQRASFFRDITSRKKSFTEEEIEQLSDPVILKLLMVKKHQLPSGRIRNPLYVNKGTLYKLYRRLLQRGEMPNALISDRDKAGWCAENRKHNLRHEHIHLYAVENRRNLS